MIFLFVLLWLQAEAQTFSFGTCNPNTTVAIGRDYQPSDPCQCKDGFKGTTCQYTCPGAPSNICSGRGACIETLVPPTFTSCNCTAANVSGVNCNTGCEVTNGRTCNGHLCVGNNATWQCQCTGNFVGLACTECLPGYYGSSCTDRCPGKPGADKSWDGCWALSGHGTCNTTHQPPKCVCQPPWITSDCSSTHFGIPASESSMTGNWLTFEPQHAVTADMFYVQFRGFRTLSSTSPMAVKISAIPFSCIGIAPNSTESMVDGVYSRAVIKAPSANGTFHLCVKWRTDWELVRTAPNTPVNLTIRHPNSSIPFMGYATCAEYMHQHAPTACGCYFIGAGGGSNVSLPVSTRVASFIHATGQLARVQQGCCWGRPTVNWVGSNWGFCNSSEAIVTDPRPFHGILV